MKYFLLSLAFLTALGVSAQQHYCADAKSHSNVVKNSYLNKTLSATASKLNDYDSKFYHFNLNVERNTKFISGSVRCLAQVTAPVLDTFVCLLHENHTIDSIYVAGVKHTTITIQDSMVKVKLITPLIATQMVDVTVYYKGTPPNGGGAIGAGFSTGTSGSWGNQATWSLSESFVAYHWWPCKQDLRDKIDSSWVFVTTDSTNKAGSNGILKNVVTVGNKKRYEWKSKTPIDYYLISVAVARYKEYNIYAKPLYLANDSILIQNYIYDNAINSSTFINGQKVELNKIKATMELLCKMYGMYPFYKEKYGHCMAPFGGGMEHQTMTSLGFFDFEIDAHELGHQWWGDNVTCKTWGDIWINEGFASYTEHLCNQFLEPSQFASSLNSAHNNVMTQPGGSIYFTNSDTMNTGRIFSSRLTYDKGGAVVRSLQFEINNDSLWFPGMRGFQNTFKNSTASAQDFKTYMETFTSMNFTQFFNQWYYGQGYPTFNVKWHFSGNTAYLESTQTTSFPSSVPIFITPLEYKLTRSGAPDTTIRVMHANTVETYSFNLTGTVTAVAVDPNNWIINKVIGPTQDPSIGINEMGNGDVSISISPNPTNGIITISSQKEIAGIVEVFDITGKLICKENIKTDLRIDLAEKASGVYSVLIKDKSSVILRREKIVKE